MPNKPDISAFGTKVHMIYNGNETEFSVGTSFSAPMVTGTVALMLEANPDLIGKPDTVKVILMQTADEDAISDENNDLVCEVVSNGVTQCINTTDSTQISCDCVLRERSGAGLLNPVGAIRSAISGMNETIVFDSMYFIPGAYWISDGYQFQAGQTIEVVMVHEKHIHDLIESQADVETNADLFVLKNSNGAVMATSSSLVNNVEIIKCTINETGYYKFKILFSSVDMVNNDSVTMPDGTTHSSHGKGYVSLSFACCNSPNLTTNNKTVYCSNCQSNLCTKI